jgi:type IV pilus assembly protein PilQ
MKRSWFLAAVAIMMVARPLPAGPGEVTAPGEVNAVSVLPGTGSALVVVDVSGAVSVQDFTLDNPARLVVDVVGATLRAPGVVYDGVNRGGILNIRYAQFRPDVVRIVLELDSVKDYRLEYADDAIRISLSSDRSFAAWSSGELPPTRVADDFASSSAPPLPEPSASQAFQSQQPRVTVTWDSASIADVMAGFAEFSGRSIVLGQDVDATVWAEISDQPWDVAFNEILQANGFEAIEDTQTGIIRVQNPAVVANRDSLEPRRTVVMPVNFKRADGIQAALQPVLQARGGTVVADQTTNQLIITDRQSRIVEDSTLVAQLDVPTAQVSIQAKLIFVDRTDIEELGVQYDLGNQDQFFNKLVQRPDPRSAAPIDTDGDGVPDAVVPTTSFDENDILIDLGGNSLSAIGNAEAIIPSPALRLIFSTAIGNFNLTSFINALQEVQLADLQAEPLISTTDNTRAEILVGERTPIRVIDAGSQQGAAGAAGIAPGFPRDGHPARGDPSRHERRPGPDADPRGKLECGRCPRGHRLHLPDAGSHERDPRERRRNGCDRRSDGDPGVSVQERNPVPSGSADHRTDLRLHDTPRGAPRSADSRDAAHHRQPLRLARWPVTRWLITLLR